MAFAASPSLSSLASSAAATASAACPISSPSSNCFHEPKPLHLSLKPFSPLPKPLPLSCSAPRVPRAATGDGSGAGSGGNDSGGNGGKAGGSGDGDGGDDDYEEAEFGRLLSFNDVLRLAAARGVALPADMMEAAKDTGIREVLLLRYFDLQVLDLLEICADGVNWQFCSFICVCAGRALAAGRDDPLLLDAPKPDARGPVLLI